MGSPPLPSPPLCLTLQIFALLGSNWRDISPEEKATCEAEAERDKTRYSEEVKALEQTTKALEQTKALPRAPVQKPAPVRTAEDLYTAEFLKALQSAAGGALSRANNTPLGMD